MAVVLDAAVTRHETWTYVRAAEIDALRAENQRLHEEIAQLDSLIDSGVLAEIDRLQAEIARLNDLPCVALHDDR